MKILTLDEFKKLIRGKMKVAVMSPSGVSVSVTKTHAVEWFDWAKRSKHLSFVTVGSSLVWIGEERATLSTKEFPFESFIVGGLQ